MTLKELLYNIVIPRIKLEDFTTVIGEGYQAKIFDRFICKKHRDICFKVFYPGKEFARDEYAILEYAYKLKLPTPKPLELFDEANTFAMEKITGFNLDEIITKNLKLSHDTIANMIEAINEVTRVINHGDLHSRNIMFGDIEIENNIITDATAYVIDFGYSTIKINKTTSNEGLSVIKLMNLIKEPKHV